MFVLFLNSTFKSALEAQGVDPCTCQDEASLRRFLSAHDIELIAHQSAGVCKNLNAIYRHDTMIFKPCIEPVVESPVDVADPYQFKAYGVVPDHLSAKALTADKVILYADSAPGDLGPRTSVNILCALNLIMSASDVMELPLFGRIAHNL